MPVAQSVLTVGDVRRVAAEAFATSGADRYGVEVEWLVNAVADELARPGLDVLDAICVGPLPAGGRVTLEPGGQVELSTSPYPTIDSVLAALAQDERVVQARAAAAGLELGTGGLDRLRTPERVLRLPRYACMQTFFDSAGEAGRWMMCNTASLQVNLSHDQADPCRRWLLLNRLAPVLLAVFANSPARAPDGSHWLSYRWRLWQSVDRSRSQPVPSSGDPVESWADYILAADVMLVRRGAAPARFSPAPPSDAG